MNKLISAWAVSMLVVAACGGSKPKAESAIVEEKGSAVPETCCCKSTPLVSEDGKALYEMLGRMECSGKHGECVDDVQCNAKAPTE